MKVNVKQIFLLKEKTRTSRKMDGLETQFFFVCLSVLLALVGQPHFYFIANSFVNLDIGGVISINSDVIVELFELSL